MKLFSFLVVAAGLMISLSSSARDDEGYNALKKKHRREQFELRAKQDQEEKAYQQKDRNWSAPGNENYFNLREKQIEEDQALDRKQREEACKQFGYLCSDRPRPE